MSQTLEPAPTRSGTRALTLVLIANGLSLLGTIVLSVLLITNVDPSGRVDTSNLLLGFLAVPYEAMPVFLGVFALQFLLAILGTIGLILAIVAAVQNRGRGRAIAAILVALIVPVVSFIAFVVIAGTRIRFGA